MAPQWECGGGGGGGGALPSQSQNVYIFASSNDELPLYALPPSLSTYFLFGEVWVRGHHIRVQALVCHTPQLLHLLCIGTWMIKKYHAPSPQCVEPALGWQVLVFPMSGGHGSVGPLSGGGGFKAEVVTHTHWLRVELEHTQGTHRGGLTLLRGREVETYLSSITAFHTSRIVELSVVIQASS